MTKKFSSTKKVSLSITMTEANREMLRRLCVHFGEPGVPLASMAATAFVRGLMTLREEMGVDGLSAAELVD
jgi:hypothetical protein